MAPQITSIQSFFQPEVPTAQKTPKRTAHHQPPDTGDGFTSSEIEAALHPSLHTWQPRTAYAETDIGNLVAGPGCVALMGRVVNFHDIATPSKMPHAAKGCLKLTVKDDTGAFTVSAALTNPILFALSNCSSLTLGHATGEAVVCQSGLQPPSGGACLDLDASRLQHGVEFPNGARRRARHVHFPRTRQQLLLHGAGTERRGRDV